MGFLKKSALSLIFSSVVILLLSAVLINAQQIEWTRTYGAIDQDGGESMILTATGEIVIAGFKSSNFVKDVLLMKTDASGNELWSRTYNLNITDWARSLKQTQDGGFIIAGMTEVSPQIYDPFLLKTDSQGNLQWVRQYDYGFGDDDRAHAVWQTSDGGYIIAGQTWLMHGAFGNYDMYIIKTDMNGIVQWTKIFFRENEGADVALGIQQLSDGGYIIGGFTQSSEWASYIIRTDNLGNALWSNIYPGAWQSECYDIQSTPDGGFIYTGTESNFTTDTDVLLVKLDANGILQWKKIYGSVEADQGEFIQQLQDGGYIIAGMSASGGSSYDMYVVRTNSTGDLLWQRTIGGSSDDRAFSIATNPDGTHLVTGWAWSYGQGLGDVYLVKLQDSVVPVELTSFTANVNGTNVILIWSTASETNNYGFVIERKDSGKRSRNIEWITIGFINGSGTTTETRSYSFEDENLSAGTYQYRLKQIDMDGTFEYLSEAEAEISSLKDFSLEQNYPNPFNPTTIIRYSIPSEEFVSLVIYNLIGEQLFTLVDEVKQAGVYEINFDASRLASGTYIYRIEAGVFNMVEKMILIK